MQNDQQQGRSPAPSNKDQQPVDKAPGEERGQAEQVTNEDLKGKKVDRDPDVPNDEPVGRP